MSDWREGLSEEQLAAVTHDAGPVIVLSGPGTGKTRVIVHRVARLINDGVDPEYIVAMTYTTKAAREMRERLARLVGVANAERVNAQTFHAFGHRLVRRFSDLLGLPARTMIADSAMIKRLMRELAADHGLFRSAASGGIDAAIARARAWIEQMGHHAITPDRARAVAATMRSGADSLQDEERRGKLAEAEQLAEVASLAELYADAKRERGWLSFEDLLTLPISLLGGSRSFAADICRMDYRRFIVDEFQDSNPAQLELLRLLAPSQTADVCVVGDDDQAIYAFRGADDRAFESFSRVWPSRRVISLTENRRSVPAIVATGNSVITRAEHRFSADKVVRAHPGNEIKPWAGVEVIRHAGETDVALVAAKLLSERHQHPERPWKEYAVLAQSHKDLDAVAAALEFEGVPVTRQKASAIIDDAGVQDVLAWLRLLAVPLDGHSGCRLLARPPHSLPPDDITSWVRRHSKAISQAREQHTRPPAFVPWLATLGDDRLKPFLDRHAELATIAATEPASELVYQIVQRTDPAHADLPAGADGRARARRVAALVALVRFARERQDRLEQPGFAREFLAYFDDLSDQERSLGPADSQLDGPPDEIGEGDGVRLSTAHSSKGLEFDTVMIVRAHPPHGFPKSRARDDDAPPDELVNSRDEAGHADEQRRLFYVACTRAKQRLIVFAKAVKKSDSVHYTKELEADAETSGQITFRVAADAMDQAARLGITLRAQSVPAESSGGRPRSDAEILAAARADARRTATLALERAGTEVLTPDQFAECEAGLAEAAARLAIADAVAKGVPPAEWLLSSAARREYHEGLAQGVHKARSASTFVFAKPQPPLKLSYSSLRDYESCPRCWYFKHVLEIPEPPSQEATVGSMVHAVLERWAKLRLAAIEKDQPEPGAEILRKLTAEQAARERALDRDLDAATIEHAVQLVEEAGKLDDTRANLLHAEREITFPYSSAGVRHSMTAKIDRVDQLDGTLRVIDYKTGAARKSLLTPPPNDLQMGIYAMAIAWSMASATDRESPEITPPPGEAQYWILTAGQRGVIQLGDLKLTKVRDQIDKLVSVILAGEFIRSESCRERAAKGESPLCTLFGEI